MLTFSLVFPQLHIQAKLRSCRAERCFFFSDCAVQSVLVLRTFCENLSFMIPAKNMSVLGGGGVGGRRRRQRPCAASVIISFPISCKSNKPHVGQVCRDENQTDLQPSSIVFGYLPWKSHTINSVANCSQTLQNWHHLLERKIVPWWGRSWGEAQLPLTFSDLFTDRHVAQFSVHLKTHPGGCKGPPLTAGFKAGARSRLRARLGLHSPQKSPLNPCGRKNI